MSLIKSFFSELFDFSFSSFITIKLIGIVYGFALIFAANLAMFAFLQFGGIIGLIAMILTFLATTIIFRIILESVIVVFRIAQNTSRTAENTKDLRN